MLLALKFTELAGIEATSSMPFSDLSFCVDFIPVLGLLFPDLMLNWLDFGLNSSLANPTEGFSILRTSFGLSILNPNSDFCGLSTGLNSSATFTALLEADLLEKEAT